MERCLIKQKKENWYFMSRPLRPHELDYLPEFAQTHVHWIDNTSQLSHPLSPASPLALNLSQHQVSSNESTLPIWWTKYCSFSISPSKQYSEWISFRIDWSPCFQKTLKSLLQHHNLKASILWHSDFFMVQLSHMYMITGKTIALNIWTFVSKVTSLLSNTLSGFVTAFLPRRKCLLISWLQSPSAGISETKKMKCDTASNYSPSICHEEIGQMPWSSFHEVKVSFKPRFLPLLPLSSRSSLVPHKFLPLKWYHLHI